MMLVRRGAERGHRQQAKRETWWTFPFRGQSDAFCDGFGELAFLNEGRLRPGARLPREPFRDGEVITYVHAGTLTYQDALGRSGLIRSGEFQCMTAGPQTRLDGTNPSRTEATHFFQLWLTHHPGTLEPKLEQRRFSAAERRGGLRIIASPDARSNSLRAQHKAVLYATLLAPGQHIAHEVKQGRAAWLHLVDGELSLGDLIVQSGDGVGVTSERAVSFTARAPSNVMLLDIVEPPETTAPDPPC